MSWKLEFERKCLNCNSIIDSNQNFVEVTLHDPDIITMVQYLCVKCAGTPVMSLHPCANCGRPFYLSEDEEEIGEPKICSDTCALFVLRGKKIG